MAVTYNEAKQSIVDNVTNKTVQNKVSTSSLSDALNKVLDANHLTAGNGISINENTGIISATGGTSGDGFVKYTSGETYDFGEMRNNFGNGKPCFTIVTFNGYDYLLGMSEMQNDNHKLYFTTTNENGRTFYASYEDGGSWSSGYTDGSVSQEAFVIESTTLGSYTQEELEIAFLQKKVIIYHDEENELKYTYVKNDGGQSFVFTCVLPDRVKYVVLVYSHQWDVRDSGEHLFG